MTELFTIGKLVRGKEPYHFQRDRPRLSDYPRTAQPNTNQPNQKFRPPVSNSTRDYYNQVYKNYLNRGK